jgi:hypothetical protein
MKTLKTYINEGKHTFKTIEDVEKYLSNFKDDETSWKGATDEIMDIARWSREHLEEFDGIKQDAIAFKNLKTPAEWNKTYKNYILDTMKKMSDGTQKEFIKYINGRL